MIAAARFPAEGDVVRELFREYAASTGFDLCFQDFDRELAALPGEYAPPRGRLLLAHVNGQLAGCVALRPLDAETCEMKRMFLRSGHRGRGLGRALATSIIREARTIGYRRMRLDTVPAMKEAIGLYRCLGFRDIASYRHNPIPGALFLELRLDKTAEA
jgi:GNAT superfamily N-acetyltransferase